MSKWRPRKDECIYIIPDVHGAYGSLDLILKRILPLRKKDKIVFLGDYIDRHIDSHKVIDLLISLKEKYGEQVICLMGNHELMLLEGFGYVDVPSKEYAENQLDMWLFNGGSNTALGYLYRMGMKEYQIDLKAFLTNPSRLKRVFPKEHIDFMKGLLPYHEESDFIFVHGGCHPEKHPSEFSMRVLCWDRSLVKLMQTLINRECVPEWEKVIVTGHSTREEPVVTDTYMMLDIGAPRKLLVVEAHTREAFIAKHDKNRLVKYEIKNSKPQVTLESKKITQSKKTGPVVRRIK